MCAKFQAILGQFANFQKFRAVKESSKMLEAQINLWHLSQMFHHEMRLSFFIKRQLFGDGYKVSNDSDTI